MNHSNKSSFDTLTEFHLQNPNCQTYSSINKIISLLKQITDENNDLISKQLQQLLTDNKCQRILKLICNRMNIDYSSIVLNTKNTSGETPAKLILHILCLSKCYQDINYVAFKLNIDSEEAIQILEHLEHTFSIEDPLIWLENFSLATKKEQKYCEKCKNDLIHGEAITNQPIDTAEDRRIKSRKKFLHFFMKW